MSKPLQGNPKREAEASAFHREVFRVFGSRCYLCKRKAPATDAAHIIPRSKLGPLRYADPMFARPAHRDCHEAQERGEIDFSLTIRRDAVRVHNKLAKVPMVMP